MLRTLLSRNIKIDPQEQKLPVTIYKKIDIEAADSTIRFNISITIFRYYCRHRSITISDTSVLTARRNGVPRTTV